MCYCVLGFKVQSSPHPSSYFSPWEEGKRQGSGSDKGSYFTIRNGAILGDLLTAPHWVTQ